MKLYPYEKGGGVLSRAEGGGGATRSRVVFTR